MNKSFQHIGIIGGGAWGTALAISMLRAGRDVTLWVRRSEIAEAINRDHVNTTYLPGIQLDPRLKATTDLAALASCDVWIMATPAQHVRATAQQLRKIDSHPAVPVILTAKGVELGSLALLSAVVAEELPDHAVAILSGPSFAHEVAQGLPAALTLAMKDKEIGKKLAMVMSAPAFRLYQTDDVIGAQIGGAVKNVLAIASGIIAGRQMGANASAALITRGLAEMMRLGAALGGQAETLMGLSGMGDLVLTCSSPQSRNMSLGIALGQGQPLAKILASRSGVTEGVTSAASVLGLAKQHQVEMPIVTAIDAVLNHHADIDAVIAGLLARPLKTEKGA